MTRTVAAGRRHEWERGKRTGRWARPRSWMIVTPVDVVTLLLPAVWAPQHIRALTAMAVLVCMATSSGHPYRAPLHLSVLDPLPNLLVRLWTAAAVVATVTALRHEQEAVTSFLITVLASIALFLLGRVLTTHLVLWARAHRLVTHRTLLVGGGNLALELATIIGRSPQYGLQVVGFVEDAPDHNTVPGTTWLGPIADIGDVIGAHEIDTVLMAEPGEADRKLTNLIWRRGLHDCDVLVVPRLYQFHSPEQLPDHIGAIPVMRVNNPSLRTVAWAAKRGFDIVVSATALVVLLPVLALCAIAVYCEGGTPVLFRQRRVGTDGQTFDCLKFRSMRPDNAGESATRWSIADDPRVGPVGKILRRSSLDELPQLWNVLRGDMTLVGPRPERPHFVGRFSSEIPHYEYRHRMRGGLTGLAQVSGLRGDTPITDRARHDNYYIDNWSLWMDAKIILRTFREVLLTKGR